MPRSFSLERLVEGVAANMRTHLLTTAELLDSPSEKGRSREDIVRDWLRQYVPARFAIGSGVVVDSRRRISRQCDVIIYDQLITKPFRFSNTVEVFPVEGVCAVGEVKSTLDKRNLMDAMDKIASVKALDRTAGGENVAYIGGGHLGQPLARTDFYDQIFGFAFGFGTTSLSSLKPILEEYRRTHSKTLLMNVACVLDQGLVGYVDRENALTVEPSKIKHSQVLKMKKRVLLVFLQELFLFLQAAHAAEANLSFYGWTGNVP